MPVLQPSLHGVTSHHQLLTNSTHLLAFQLYLIDVFILCGGLKDHTLGKKMLKLCTHRIKEE